MLKLYICRTTAGVLRVVATRIRWRCRSTLSHLSARTLTGIFDQWRILLRRLSSDVRYNESLESNVMIGTLDIYY